MDGMLRTSVGRMCWGRLLCCQQQTPSKSHSLHVLLSVTIQFCVHRPGKSQQTAEARVGSKQMGTARAVDAPRSQAGAEGDAFCGKDDAGGMHTQIRSQAAPPSKAQTKLRASPSSSNYKKALFFQMCQCGEENTACETQNTRMRFLRSPEATGSTAELQPGAVSAANTHRQSPPRAAQAWAFSSQAPCLTHLRVIN